jgi:hypothetical protein
MEKSKILSNDNLQQSKRDVPERFCKDHSIDLSEASKQSWRDEGWARPSAFASRNFRTASGGWGHENARPGVTTGAGSPIRRASVFFKAESRIVHCASGRVLQLCLSGAAELATPRCAN